MSHQREVTAGAIVSAVVAAACGFILVSAMIIAASGAYAQTPTGCLNSIPVDGLKKRMLDVYGEVPHAMAWAGDGTILIYKHPKNNTWTAFKLDPSNSCARVIGDGEAWTDFDPPKNDKPA